MSYDGVAMWARDLFVRGPIKCSKSNYVKGPESEGNHCTIYLQYEESLLTNQEVGQQRREGVVSALE